MDTFYHFNFCHNRIKGFWFATVLKVKNYKNALHLLNNLQFSSKLEKFGWSGVRSTWLWEHFPFLYRVTVLTLCFGFLSWKINLLTQLNIFKEEIHFLKENVILNKGFFLTPFKKWFVHILIFCPCMIVKHNPVEKICFAESLLRTEELAWMDVPC